MPDLYIDSNATGANDGTSWADAYSDIVTATLGTWAAGETAWIASDHLKDYGATTTINFPDDSILISVNSSTDAYSPGAHEKVTGGIYDLSIRTVSFSKFLYIYGVDFTAQDDILFNMAETQYYLSDSTLSLVGSSADMISIGVDGTGVYFKNADISFNANSQNIRVYSGDVFSLDGGSVNSTCEVFIDYFGSGGATTNVDNYDFSAMTSGSITRVGGINDDTINANFTRCKMPASGVAKVSSGKAYSRTQSINFWSCDNGGGYHYFHHTVYGGVVEESTTVYRTGGSTYDGTNGFSKAFQPNSDVIAYIEPLEFKLIDLELDLTSVNTLTFQLAFGDDSDPIDTFTNADAWIKLVQNDSDDLALGVAIESKPAEILTTPTDLTSSSESWNSGGTTLELSYNNSDKRQISIDTVAVPTMTNGQVTAYLCIAKYVSTLEIFGCAKPDIT